MCVGSKLANVFSIIHYNISYVLRTPIKFFSAKNCTTKACMLTYIYQNIYIEHCLYRKE